MTRLGRRRILVLGVLILALVAAGLLGSREADGPVSLAAPASDVSGGPTLPATPSSTDRAAIVPTASATGSFSTTWFCVGGAGTPDGLAPATLVLVNRGSKPTTATLSAYAADGTTVNRSVDLAPGGQVEQALADLLPSPTVSVVVEADGGDVTAAQRYEAEGGAGVVPCSSRASTQWYFAAGSTDRGADEHLIVFNPFPDPATVDVTYFLPDGLRRPERAQGIPVPGGAAVNIRVGDTQDRVLTIGAAVTTRTGRVVVARVQSFDGTGEVGATGAPPQGLSLTIGNPWASDDFVLADGRFGEGLATQVVVTNPGPHDSSVRLEIQLDQPDVNGQPTPLTLKLPANSWKVLGPDELRQLPPGVPFSVRGRVTSGGPVVAEAWLFGNDPAVGHGVSVVQGMAVSATDWMLPVAVPEGVVDRLSVVSTGPAATLSLLLVTADGSRVALPLPADGPRGVGAGGRTSIDLAALLAEHPGSIVLVHADKPVVIARSWFGVEGKGLPVLGGFPLKGTITLL